METQRLTSQSELVYKKRADLGQKFKTEMCRNFPLGLCKFGDKCAFAHSSEEIRGKNKFTFYKTKDCKQFHELGYCQYGKRCQFKHKVQLPETASNSPDAERSPIQVEKRRLPVFAKLAPN